MSATDTFHATSEFVLRLRSLRQQRRKDKRRETREPLSGGERLEILKKTAYRCHICGGKIDGKWEADHVYSHALGGEHALENYLPAHQICNGYRWFYGDEEFQWILKLGVWLRTQSRMKRPWDASRQRLFARTSGLAQRAAKKPRRTRLTQSSSHHRVLFLTLSRDFL